MYSTRENIKKSLKLAWQHKILWVFALLALGGGLGNFRSSFSEPLQQMEKQNNEPVQKEGQVQKMSYTFSPGDSNSNQFKDVLGAQDAAETPSLTTTFLNDLGHVNLTVPAILAALSFLIFLGYAILVGFLLKGWSKSALLAGTIRGLEDEKLDLKTLGKIGRANMVKFIKVEILTVILGMGSMALTFALAGLLFFLSRTFPPLTIIVTIVAALLLMFGTVFSIFIMAGLIFSLRQVLTNKISTFEAVKFGLLTLSKNFWNYFKLSITSAFIALGSLIGLALILGAAGGMLYLLYNLDKGSSFNRFLLILSGLFSVPLMIGVGVAMEVLWGYVRTYFEFAYSILYLHTQNIDDSRTVKLMGEDNGN